MLLAGMDVVVFKTEVVHWGASAVVVFSALEVVVSGLPVEVKTWRRYPVVIGAPVVVISVWDVFV